jgi:cell division protein FtsL
MSVPYVIFLTVAVVAVVFMCIQYLALNSDISEAKKNIALLENNIDTIAAQNDAMDYEINGFVDVANVMQIAVEELGMVPAGKDQIMFYESSDTEYMKQFDNIPKYSK